MPTFSLKANAATTLEEALTAIDNYHRGFIVLTELSGILIGTITDGDVRRAILGGASMSDPALPFANTNCLCVHESTTREQMLRLFDQRIRFLPMIDSKKMVTNVVTVDDLKYPESKELIAKSKAPARISFGGGGTDLTPFFVEHGGAVLNSTINMYSRATLKCLPGTKSTRIISEDFGSTVEAPHWEALQLDGNLDLLKAAVKLLRPNFGFELTVASDFPPSSGLGGSSVVLAAVIGAFNQFRDDKLSLYDIAELAFQAERLELGCAGGWQDQYAAVFGGINFMEFRTDRNEINTLKIHPDILNELEDRLLICFSGKPHPLNTIHTGQAVNMVSRSETTEFAHKTRELAFTMKHALQRGHLDQLGNMLHEAWTMKKKLSTEISNSHLDELYEFARSNGAQGGKILGAGGGGYFLFQAKPFARKSLIQALSSRGLLTHGIMFDPKGLQSWLVK